jgi:glycerol-3-phosphate dehydrogenase (NAD(P)+)
MNVTILGAGAWGTAVAIHAAKQRNSASDKKRVVTLWARDVDQAAQMETTRRNNRYLSGIDFPPDLVVETDFDRALLSVQSKNDLLIIATPLSGLASTCQRLLKSSTTPLNWVWLCKGIEPDSSALPHEIVEREIRGHEKASQISFGVLSGPSFAIEVARGLPCALTVASQFSGICELTQQALHHGSMRIYATDDLVGVELGGAVKNVLAIATGIVDGMGLGLNARAGLITRGMAEMARLGQALGARSETFAGLAGLGDLILTATGDLSRNRQVGLELAKGKSLEQILKDLGHVAEGVRCATAVLALAKKSNVQMPIVEAVCQVLFSNMAPKEAVMQLMARDARSESD